MGTLSGDTGCGVISERTVSGDVEWGHRVWGHQCGDTELGHLVGTLSGILGMGTVDVGMSVCGGGGLVC